MKQKALTDRQNKALVKRLSRLVTKHHEKWLKSEGMVQLILGKNAFAPLDSKITISIGYSYTMPTGHKFTRMVQRTFYEGRPTKVPRVAASRFLEYKEIAEFKTETANV